MKTTQTIYIECDNEKNAEKVFNYLNSTYPECGWDVYHSVVVQGSIGVTAWYESPVYYYPNGDGYPGGTFIEDGFDEDELSEELQENLRIKTKVITEVQGLDEE